MRKILFVCLGNICRSPMGEGALLHVLDEREMRDGYIVDSAGTSAYHVGEKADARMRDTAQQHGVVLTSRARQVTHQDFADFDLILAMDKSNYSNLMELAHDHGHDGGNVVLLRDFDDQARGADVPDPYYGGADGFEEVYQIVMRCCNNLVNDSSIFSGK